MSTRGQKRWSARLRTGGALLGLLGLVALFDAPLFGAGLALFGAAIFALGRRWM
jgi:hypothetical protein